MNDPVIYRIDRFNTITFVNEVWCSFAKDNDASHLTSPFVLGKNLWDLIADRDIGAAYSAIISRVRDTGRSVSFNFRCDSPSCRRLMLMTIAPLEEGMVEFQSQLIKLESREKIRLLSKDTPREESVLVMCSWCKNVKMKEGKWVEVEEALKFLELMTKPRMPRISHGICSACKRLLPP